MPKPILHVLGYKLVLNLYLALVRGAAYTGHRQAAALIRGRRRTRNYLRQASVPDPHALGESTRTGPWIWFHAASAGELEQALPLMAAWRRRCPEDRILLSIYSPSAYREGHTPPEADLCLMLPADQPQEVRLWLDAFKPSLAVFVKYEYWFHFFEAMHRRGIPLYLVCVRLGPEHPYLKPWIKPWWMHLAQCVTAFMVQDLATAHLLQSLGLSRIHVCGDTRFERVGQMAALAFEDKVLSAFATPETDLASRRQPVLVGGSTWGPDHRLLARILDRQRQNPGTGSAWRLILVPHEVDTVSLEHLHQVLVSYPQLCWSTYSRLHQLPASELARTCQGLHLLVVDRKGLLSRIYRYGQAAWVGGGYGVGLHNILEPAVYGLRVAFGPNYRKSLEARELLELGYASALNGTAPQQEEKLLNFLENALKDGPEMGQQIKAYCAGKSGASACMLQHILGPEQP